MRDTIVGVILKFAVVIWTVGCALFGTSYVASQYEIIENRSDFLVFAVDLGLISGAWIVPAIGCLIFYVMFGREDRSIDS